MATAQNSSAAESCRSRVETQLQNIREHLPDRRQIQGTLSWILIGLAPFIIGLLVLTVSGVTLTAGAIVLAVATPILLVCSPVLVPLGAIVVLMVIVAAIGVASFAAAVWLYRYLKGEEPIYYDRIDAARSRIAGTAHEVKGRALDHVPQAAPSA